MDENHINQSLVKKVIDKFMIIRYRLHSMNYVYCVRK